MSPGSRDLKKQLPFGCILKEMYPAGKDHISHLGKKENHLQNAIFGGYVSSLAGYI